MSEYLDHPPLPRVAFLRRIAGRLGVAGGVVGGSLLVGMAGYVWFEGLSWLDAFLNAAMLLGGMGPVETPQTSGGKLFAGLYALYAGLVFLLVVGIVFTPVAHRVLHQFHWEQSERSRVRQKRDTGAGGQTS